MSKRAVAMAENKKSFLLYCDTIHTVNELTDAEAGKLFKHVLAYVNDLNPQTDDKLIKIAFEPIKQSLKRDLQKYESIREQKREAGRKSAEARKQASTRVESVEQTATDSTVSVSVSVSDSVNDKNFLIDKGANEISEMEIGQTIQFMAITCQWNMTADQVKSYWQAFNIHSPQNFEPHNKHIQHFRNWLKKQPKENGKRIQSVRSTNADPTKPGYVHTEQL